MEIQNKKEMELKKKSTSYKIIIPANVERLIRFLCAKVWDTEWSGVLFYNHSGQFEDNSLTITCVDILPMDIGTTTYTEFSMSPDVISYMAQNPELLDCKMGLIHSHNNMATFFSGTDIATLKEEGAERNHFVSLIVNNAGTYTAAITRKIKYKAVRELSYESFDTEVKVNNKEEVEGEELEYFNLDIVLEEDVDNRFSEIETRLKEIKEAKEKVIPKTYNTPGTPYWYKPTDKQEEKKQPTLFDELDTDWSDSYPKWKGSYLEPLPYAKSTLDTHMPISISDSLDDIQSAVTDELIESIMTQLITGSVTITKLDKKVYDKAACSIMTRFGKRFKGDKKLFSNWAMEFTEFLLWNSVDDPELDECDVTSEIASRLVEELRQLPENIYVNEYIDCLMPYAR